MPFVISSQSPHELIVAELASYAVELCYTEILEIAIEFFVFLTRVICVGKINLGAKAMSVSHTLLV